MPALLPSVARVVDAELRRVGLVIRGARSRQWRVRADFAEACGVSLRLIADLELGHRANFSPEVIDAVEATLRWAPGSIKRVRDGLRPRLQPDAEFAELWDLWPRLSIDGRRMLVEIAKAALR